jgi:hypothetical protein
MFLFISDQMAPVYCIMLQGERRPLSSVSSCSLTTRVQCFSQIDEIHQQKDAK